MSDDRLNLQLEQMAGSPAVARAIKDALNRLRGGAAGPDLAEMARDVLDGHSDLRTVGQSSAYSTPMTEAIGKFQDWQEELTPEEREAFISDARARLNGQELPADATPPADAR
ncbi:hypothetical protein [Actinoplanes friuliensis]|uniref:hypothetical protein n=1 Tax=Actinoplanes friuliensis TaxID=196914 RepID=UPI0011DD2A96|nr:hypothetical protein [Actinoplanes friuliensis]